MKPTTFTPHSARWVRTGLGCCLLLVISLTVVYAQQPAPDLDKQKLPPLPPGKASPVIVKQPVEPGAVEVAFTDGSNLKLLLREDKIALTTPYGKLNIAVADIQRIEFATRISDEDAKQIKTAIADLGNADFDKREAASTQLLKLRERGYPALQRAVGQSDPEVVRRARELIQQISTSVPADQLTVRPKDVIYTADSMIAGRIEGMSLKAHTSQFGGVQVKLADVRNLRSQAIQAERLNPTPAGLDSMIQQRQMEIQRLRREQMELLQRQRQMQMQAK